MKNNSFENESQIYLKETLEHNAMKSSTNIPSPHTSALDINSNMMKPPYVSSIPSPLAYKHTIPYLLDIDPAAPFEFSFPCEDMWWDISDLDSSAPEDDPLDDSSDLNVSFSSSFYQIFPGPDFTDDEDEEDDVNKEGIETDDMKNEEVVGVPSDRFIGTILSVICHTCPGSKYRRRKAAKKRRKKRRQRKLATADQIEPEFKSLWLNAVGDLFAPSAVPKMPPPSSLPTINLSTVNKSMLRRLPDVIEAPVHSCSQIESFYTKVVCQHYATKFTSTPTPRTQHQQPTPFGSFPAIETDFGCVPPPTESTYGYVFSDGKWRVKAQYPRVPDPGGGHGRG